MIITTRVAKRLLELYAAEGPRTCRSCLGASGGDPDSGILLTVACAITHTPPAYRYDDTTSPLAKWVECYARECRIVDELGATRQQIRSATRANIVDRATERSGYLARALELASEQTQAVETHQRFRDAVEWLSYWLTEATRNISDAERAQWHARMLDNA